MARIKFEKATSIVNSIDGDKFLGLHCVAPDPGMTNSINEKLEMLADADRCPFAQINFCTMDLPEGAAASFSYGGQLGGGTGTVRVDLGPEFEFDPDTKCIYIPTNFAACILQHELNHFVHIHICEGKYTHPFADGYRFKNELFARGKMPETNHPDIYDTMHVVKMNEIECGWRCLRDDVQFGVAKEVALLDRKIQLRNLYIYDKPDFFKLYDEFERELISRLAKHEEALREEEKEKGIEPDYSVNLDPDYGTFLDGFLNQMSMRNINPTKGFEYTKVAIPASANSLPQTDEWTEYQEKKALAKAYQNPDSIVINPKDFMDDVGQIDTGKIMEHVKAELAKQNVSLTDLAAKQTAAHNKLAKVLGE